METSTSGFKSLPELLKDVDNKTIDILDKGNITFWIKECQSHQMT
jgi:hypothetical protein